MPRRILFTLPAVLVATALWLGADAHAQQPADPGRAEHERVVRYWTPDRVARALPRDLDRDLPARPVAPNARPGGGGGGGGGTSVTGTYWTAGGLVKQTTGRVMFTLGTTDYVCSGSVVTDGRADASVVLTAGHCVFDDARDVWATNWLFVPDYETAKTFNCDATRFGCWTAQALVTTTAWANGDFNEDFAFAVMRAGGKAGQQLQLESVVGTQAISFTLAHPRQVYAFGYPAAKPYNGQRLAYCSGTTVPDTWGGSTDFGLECNMTGGSSGGPWFADFNPTTGAGTLISVNSFKYRGLSKYMFGPYFDAYAAQAFQIAQTAAGNTLVTAP